VKRYKRFIEDGSRIQVIVDKNKDKPAVVQDAERRAAEARSEEQKRKS